jgi:hypothetical protein
VQRRRRPRLRDEKTLSTKTYGTSGVNSSIITLLGMLSPKGPANEAAPLARRRELHHESGGQTSEKRVHGFLQDAGSTGSAADGPLLLSDRPTGLSVHVGC